MLLWAALCGWLCSSLPSIAADQTPFRSADTLPRISMDQFLKQSADMQRLTLACEASSAACDGRTVVQDAVVSASGPTPAFIVRWFWLQHSLEDAAKAKAGERKEAMSAANQHIQDLVGASQAVPSSDQAFAKAHAQAANILARTEFAGDTSPSWWDRKVAVFWALIANIFFGVGNIGKNNPWLWTAFEILFYLGAAVGLLLFVRKALARQRLAVSLNAQAARPGAWDKEAEDWAALAEACAAQQQWRDAVHCLYWASIVRLEARRAWRHDPTRTPREYVRLLQPGSNQQASLRSLTRIFERVWYGLRNATASDYTEARNLFASLDKSGLQASAAEAA